MWPGRVVDDSPSTVKAVYKYNRNSMPFMSAWRAKGYLEPYSGSSTIQLVISLISITIRSDVSSKSRTLPHTILSGEYVFTCVCLHRYPVRDRDAVGV